MAIEASARIMFLKRHHLRELGRTLIELRELELISLGAYVEDINTVKAELQQFETERYKGALIRSRAHRFLNEQPTRRALSDERQTALAKEILEIQYEGCTYNDAPGIRDAFFDYYRKLFGSCGVKNGRPDFSSILKDFPCLEDDQRAVVEGLITLDEIKSAISELQSQKSPGPDGITGEFYKLFAPCLAPVLMEVFHASYDVAFLPPTFYCGRTILIPKSTDTNPLKTVEGYRRIALCNMDYKLFAKVLFSRLQLVITDLIGSHQVFGIRGRIIQTHIHTACSVLETVSDETGQVALIQNDLAKAFYKVRHGFLFAVLKHANIGDVLLKGIRLC